VTRSSSRGARRDGILVVDKPSGPTSHDIVAQARRVFGTPRVGHAGTLDPMATGVLILLIGEATKLSDVASCEDKAYSAEVRFGRATDSYDADGQTCEEHPPAPGWLSAAALQRALDAERQRTLQVPPVVSAIKIGGQRAYQLARAGTPPLLEPRPVRVHALEALAFDDASVELELHVTKGYFVRSLAHDLSKALGVPAHLGRLRRLRSGSFGIERACAWPPVSLPELIPLREALPQLLPTWRLTPLGVERARQGKTLSPAEFAEPVPDPEAALAPSIVAWTDGAGTPVALGRPDGAVYRVKRGFAADMGADETPPPAPFALPTPPR
jgi:tRNA pseudouridine55 synthase